MNLHADQDERLYAEELTEATEECLRTIAVRNVSCRYEDGFLFLRGQVPSFYHKQHIQEAVVGLKGMTRVKNEVVVAPRPR